MHDVMSEAGERGERTWRVEIPPERSHAELAQQREPLRVARQRVDAVASGEQRRQAPRDVAKADDEQTFHNRILA